MAEAGAEPLPVESPESAAPVSPENPPAPESPACPTRPSLGDCPFAQCSAEWKNWYAHFGYELVRWGQFLSTKISRMPEDAGSIKWKALGLHDVKKQQDPVLITRVSRKPVVNTADNGITVAENCDIVTYQGTGVLINKGKGVVINNGSGIVINHSRGTCNNAADGIVISLGKGTMVNTGQGYGILKSCQEVPAEERVVLNDVGGIVIKDAATLLRICDEERANNDEDEDAISSSEDGDSDPEGDATLDPDDLMYLDSESEVSLEDFSQIGVFLTEASDFTSLDDEDSDGAYLSDDDDDGTSNGGQSDMANNNHSTLSQPQVQIPLGIMDGTIAADVQLDSETSRILHQIASDLFPTDDDHGSDLESDTQDQGSADDEESSSPENCKHYQPPPPLRTVEPRSRSGRRSRPPRVCTARRGKKRLL